MNGEEYQIAMTEIGLGKTWEESAITPKNLAKKADWDELLNEFNEAEKNGWTVEIPSEMP